MKKLVIASNNPGKLREIAAILAPLRIEVLPQGALGVPEAEEPHCSFVENALAKARHASRLTGLPALADDSGVCVHVLGGEPGVHSARYAASAGAVDLDRETQDRLNNEKLLQALAGAKNRSAHYCCVIVVVRHAGDPQPLIAEADWHGTILEAPRGDGGFGYDPLFLIPELGRTGAELAAEEKNSLSHRGRALAMLAQRLQELRPG
ncbi:MAG: RdgB/HAM1 family non-canonical purine NTP pyrophosphatase [Burkholderiales bacterium]|nr:RdgB/HAM1 family non-canonical purine NTP pyrophosphatase [Burkholderiales bacterium]